MIALVGVYRQVARRHVAVPAVPAVAVVAVGIVRVWKINPVAMRALVVGEVSPSAMKGMDRLEHMVRVTPGHCRGDHR